MQAELDKDHAEMLLKTHNFGRLGCCTHNQPYIVPISYVYENGYIYSHTNDGKKLQMMRENSAVCFEVDEIKDFRLWRSVICMGRFEELDGDDMARAINLMIERLTPFALETTLEKSETLLENISDQIRLRPRSGSTFRIHVTEISGRFERP